MKTSRYLKPLASFFLAVGVLGFGSCSDTWDNHYGNEDNQMAADQPSLYELIKADPTLNEFVRVLDKTGYDKVLNGPQALTVWAPQLTAEEADSVIALYNEQKQQLVTMPDGSVRNIQDKDNKAITQFLQNHIALYGRSVYEDFSDTIRMMNGKYFHLTDQALANIPFERKNVVANNGVLYVLRGKETFHANVREALLLTEGLDSVAAFYTLFDQYSLDELASVQRGIINGRIVYADSVLNLSNQLYSSLGWINREDSSYLFLAPNNEVWAQELERFRPMFNYTKEMENRDSVALLNAKMAIIRGRIFNLKAQVGKTVEEADTLMNTIYVRDKDYYGMNVFNKVQLLQGLTPWTASNGRLYVDNNNRIDSKLTFLEARYVQAAGNNFKLGQLYDGRDFVNLADAEVRTFVDTVTYGKESEAKKFDVRQLKRSHYLQGDNYLEVTPLTYGSTKSGRIYFYLPNTLAGVYYNVYVVMVPAFLNSDGYNSSDVLPLRFSAYFHERLDSIRTEALDSAFLQQYPNEDLKYEASKKDNTHILSVPDSETQYRDNATNFLASGNDVDVICIDKARKCSMSSYNQLGRAENIMRYCLVTTGRKSAIGSTQTDVMRINRIIYIPFETAKEAEDFDIRNYLNDDATSNLKEYNINL